MAAGPRERPDGLERAPARLADKATGGDHPADQGTSANTAAQAPAAAQSAAVPAPGRPYKVQAGDTFWDIASGHDVTVDALLAANHLDAQALLQPGQTLLLPGGKDNAAADPTPAAAAPRPAPAKSAPDLLYTIQPGDTLWDIAATHDLTVAALVAANNLDEAALLQPGQTLRVPAGNVAAAPADAAAKTPTAGKPAQGYTYTIQASDTLWDIAASHGLTVDALLAANQLDAAGLLHPGQQLFVPASPLPAKAQAKAAAAPPAAGPVPAVPQALAAWPAALLDLINAQRTGRGLAGLTWSNELAAAAQAHAADCERRGWGGHVGSDGARLAARLARAGFAARYAGENWANALGVNATFNMWWNEPPGADPHRQNVLSPLYHEIGIGVADAGWGYYFIADFGSR